MRVCGKTKGNWFINLGRFSNDCGGGSVNVTIEINSRVCFFRLFGVYYTSHKMANEGEFPWSWFLMDGTKVWKEKEKFVAMWLCPSNNVAWENFMLRYGGGQRNIPKKMLLVQNFFFSLIKLLIKLISLFDALVAVAVIVTKAPRMNRCIMVNSWESEYVF